MVFNSRQAQILSSLNNSNLQANNNNLGLALVYSLQSQVQDSCKHLRLLNQPSVNNCLGHKLLVEVSSLNNSQPSHQLHQTFSEEELHLLQHWEVASSQHRLLNQQIRLLFLPCPELEIPQQQPLHQVDWVFFLAKEHLLPLQAFCSPA